MSNTREQLTELTRAIRQAKLDFHQRDRLESELHEARALSYQEDQKLANLSQRMSQLAAEIGRLQSRSLTGFIASVRGDKDATLVRHRAELEQLQSEYDQSASNAEFLRDEVNELENRFRAIGNPVERRRELTKKKEAILETIDGPHREELVDLSRRMSLARAREKRTAEVMEVGDRALAGLRQMLTSLSSASKWGMYDIVAGGMLASMAKHVRINQAKQELQKVEGDLKRFEQEMRELIPERAIELAASVNFGDVGKMVDVFFDNVVVDILMQNRIGKAQREVLEVVEDVMPLVAELSSRRQAIHDEVVKLEEAREKLIEGA